MNKVFNITPENATWCENDCITVCAADENEALKLVEGQFNDQGSLTVTEIDFNKSCIINVSNVGA